MKKTLFSIPLLIVMATLATRFDEHRSHSFHIRRDGLQNAHALSHATDLKNHQWSPANNFFNDSTLSLILNRGLRPLVKPQISGARIKGTELVVDSLFPVPPQIRDNVTFWKKIFTEVSIAEGLLHDREYPLIIYEKMNFYDMSERQRAQAIRSKIDSVQKNLQVILTSPDSTWNSRERYIAALFKRHAKEGALSDAPSRIRLQSGIRERFKWGLEQATMFYDTIKTILRQYQVPENLAYLPHVESSFDIFARSKVGALGMWQFMPATARRYLQIDELIDERLDPIRSTEAAAKLLAHNFSILESWPLAVTAYNHGVTGMKRAVRTTGTRDLGEIINRHSSPSFQFASKNFYSCFIAATQVASSPELYFKNLAILPAYKTHTIDLKHPVDPSTLSTYLNITVDLLAFYNPALNPELFKPGQKIPRNYRINIPMLNRRDDSDVSFALSGGILGMKAFFGAIGDAPHFADIGSASGNSTYRVMDGRIRLVRSTSSFSAMVTHRFNVPHAPLPYETTQHKSSEAPLVIPVSVYRFGPFSVAFNRL